MVNSPRPDDDFVAPEPDVEGHLVREFVRDVNPDAEPDVEGHFVREFVRDVNPDAEPDVEGHKMYFANPDANADVEGHLHRGDIGEMLMGPENTGTMGDDDDVEGHVNPPGLD